MIICDNCGSKIKDRWEQVTLVPEFGGMEICKSCDRKFGELLSNERFLIDQAYVKDIKASRERAFNKWREQFGRSVKCTS